MNLEQQIHKFIVSKCCGLQKNIKGVSQTTLSKMKKGESGMSTKKLAEILQKNEIEGSIILEHENTKTTIKLF